MIWKNFQHNFQQFENQFQSQMVHWFEEAMDHLPPHWGARRLQPRLERVIDQFRPAVRALRLRVSCLQLNKIEMTLPARRWVQNENREVEEGAIISAATQCFKLLWKRNAPPRTLEIHIENLSLEFMKVAAGTLHFRAELGERQRESVLADLLNQKKSQHEMMVRIFDVEEQLVATATIKGQITWTHSLEWKP